MATGKGLYGFQETSPLRTDSEREQTIKPSDY